MKLVFFGTPEFAVPSLGRLLQHPNFQVMAVVTQPDRRRGRGKQLIPSPIKAVAQQHSLPVFTPERIKKDEVTLDQLNGLNADAFVVVAYGQILSQRILDMPRLGCVNAHGSILPQYRGAAPIQWSLYHGEAETGITTMLMDAGMDTGDMLLKATTRITLADHAQTLGDRLAQMSADLLVDTLQALEAGTVTPTPQNHGAATYAPLIQKSDYTLDWSRSAIALHNQIRGFYPNCTSIFRQQSLKILETFPLANSHQHELPEALRSAISAQADDIPVGTAGQPGEVVTLLKNWGPVVQTGEGSLLLKTVQPLGKRPQSGNDFVNGSRLAVGEVFEAISLN